MKLRSLSSRIALVFALLFAAGQAGVLLLVDTASLRIARERSAEELRTGERVLRRLLDQNRQSVLQTVDVLARDFAFRKAVATGDSPTIGSALANHGSRIHADVAMLAFPDGRLIDGGLHGPGTVRNFPEPDLLLAAESLGRASAIVPVGDRLYQLVVVPVLAPDPIAWVAMGVSADRSFLAGLQALTSLDVSFMRSTGHGWQVLASTRPLVEAGDSLGRLPAEAQAAAGPLRLAGYDTFVTTLPQEGAAPLTVALQLPADHGMAQFERLKSILGLVMAVSIVATVLGSVVMARRITQPLAALSAFSERVRDGDYSGRMQLERSDEIGALSKNFDHMLEGIAAREAEILRLAYLDTLTELPNRTMFNSRLAQELADSRKDDAPLSVLIMDLDRFKLINNTLGHGAGNKVLQAVAARLREVVRESDTVCRLGGDEFAILLVRADAKRALAVGRMIQTVLEEPIMLDGQSVDVGSSIGIAQSPIHGEAAGLLMRRADIAMYAAKREKSGVAVYEERMESYGAGQLSLLSDLRRAIADGQLSLHYQPKVDLRTSQVVGAEALVRWFHPERGQIPPSDFILFAEQTGAIREVTRWVAGEAVRQCGAWLADGLACGVSINASSRDLLDRELPQVVADLLRRHAMDPALLTIEVTESALMEDPNRAQETVKALKGLGVRLSIDDYGTGYSSLAYIQRLQCDELKVDRAFVTHAVENSRDSAIIKSTIELGHALGLSVVAEGVETAEGMQVLQSLGCDMAQGYWISRALPQAEFRRWMDSSEWNSGRRRPDLLRVV
ncbi:MAG TPA: EAL domain-containing protein [Burkholderiales bacterium]|nr:EAL domain-containing protein [Burkholderiales bacterium]